MRQFEPEWRTFTDDGTGARLTQWTAHRSMHHHCYFTNPTTSAGDERGHFISWRSGYPNLFGIDLRDGRLTQITDRADINPFSAAPARQEASLYFSARDAVWRVDAETGREDRLAAFDGAQLGNCSLSHDDRWLAIGVRRAGGCELALINTATGRADILLRRDEVGHIQFCPADPMLLLFSGPVTQRMWLHDRRTGATGPLYAQTPGEWIVHESWRGGAEVIFPHWPHALRAIRPADSAVRTIAAVNAWHACASPDGTTIVCDTNHPDRGLLLIDAATGAQRLLCRPKATQRGTQWRHDRPAAGAGIDTSIIRSPRPEDDRAPTPDEPEGVYGPQWSHPHPSFSRDGRRVIFTSDRDGWSQVFSTSDI